MSGPEIEIGLAIRFDEVPNLRAAVGWSRRDHDYPALFERCVFWAGARGASGELVAFAYVAGTGLEHGYVEDVMVHPAWQRRGIGQALVRRLVEEASLRDISIVSVTFQPQHLDFYVRCGFSPCPGGLWRAPERKAS